MLWTQKHKPGHSKGQVQDVCTRLLAKLDHLVCEKTLLLRTKMQSTLPSFKEMQKKNGEMR